VELKHLSEEIEAISKGYAEKYAIERDATWFLLKLQEEVGELIQSYLMLAGKARKKGKTPEELQAAFEEEVADVFCQTLLLARLHHIDIEEVVKKKWLYWKNA
jgi:NTP pyrophosphatase (non-canonical NTP hydrolase)